MACITLLTDFGTRDGYVGAMKGAMTSVHPGVDIHDVGHGLRQGDVRGAGQALARYWDRYPPGTVHVAVIDPGVGTERRAMAVEVEQRYLVVPDNGLVSPVLESEQGWRAVSLENPEFFPVAASATFHGRDIFAPAAALLARGLPLSRLGPQVLEPVLLDESLPERGPEGVRGEVIGIDHFGNLITNVPGTELEGAAELFLGDRPVPVARTYGEVAPLHPLALENSSGRVEVAVRNGSAAELLDSGLGAPVFIPARKREPPTSPA
ncbi:MAG: SAM-dependent chlorinase/fluorinase [Gemmatimonadota bacterium]